MARPPGASRTLYDRRRPLFYTENGRSSPMRRERRADLDTGGEIPAGRADGTPGYGLTRISENAHLVRSPASGIRAPDLMDRRHLDHRLLTGPGAQAKAGYSLHLNVTGPYAESSVWRPRPAAAGCPDDLSPVPVCSARGHPAEGPGFKPRLPTGELFEGDAQLRVPLEGLFS